MDADDYECAARAALAARDLDAAASLTGRPMDPKVKRALRAFVGEALADPDEAARIYLASAGGSWARRAALEALKGRLGDARGAGRQAALQALRGLARALPEDPIILGALIGADALPQAALRALAARAPSERRARTRSALPARAIAALVRAGDLRWIEQHLRAGGLDPEALRALPRAASQDRRAARRVARLAAELDEPTLLLEVLRLESVHDDLIRRGLASEGADVRAAAVARVGGLRDARELLRAALSDPAPGVRRAALEVLSAAPDRSLRTEIAALVDDPDPWDERYNPRPISDLAHRILRTLDDA